MDKPNLNRMWETFFRMSLQDISVGNHIEKMRSLVFPLVTRLKGGGLIDWYCLLIHDKDSGVPTDDSNPYLHLRVAFTKELSEDEVRRVLPTDLPERSPRPMSGDRIAGIRTSLIKNEDIAEAWRIIGEQTEWMFSMINVFKMEMSFYPEIFPSQIQQFLHYYHNALQV